MEVLTYICAVCKSYVRDDSPAKYPEKVQYLWYLKLLVIRGWFSHGIHISTGVME